MVWVNRTQEGFREDRMSETNVSKKARQREQLVLALLQQPSFDKAAASIGMSTTTAWRIRKTAAFQEEYKKARGEAHSQSIARLQQASSAAVSTLVKVMVDPNAPATSRVRAAHWVLSHASEGTEY